jgi:hypothetical protein
MLKMKVGTGARRTLTVRVEEDDGTLAPLSGVVAVAQLPGGPWTSAAGEVQTPNTSAKVVLEGSLTALAGDYDVVVTASLADGDVEPMTLRLEVR